MAWKYHTKPVEVEAMQVPPFGRVPVSSASADDVLQFLGTYGSPERVQSTRTGYSFGVWTEHGIATADPGDWLIRNLNGRIWVVVASDFKAHYEPVDSTHEP